MNCHVLKHRPMTGFCAHDNELPCPRTPPNDRLAVTSAMKFQLQQKDRHFLTSRITKALRTTDNTRVFYANLATDDPATRFNRSLCRWDHWEVSANTAGGTTIESTSRESNPVWCTNSSTPRTVITEGLDTNCAHTKRCVTTTSYSSHLPC